MVLSPSSSSATRASLAKNFTKMKSRARIFSHTLRCVFLNIVSCCTMTLSANKEVECQWSTLILHITYSYQMLALSVWIPSL